MRSAIFFLPFFVAFIAFVIFFFPLLLLLLPTLQDGGLGVGLGFVEGELGVGGGGGDEEDVACMEMVVEDDGMMNSYNPADEGLFADFGAEPGAGPAMPGEGDDDHGGQPLVHGGADENGLEAGGVAGQDVDGGAMSIGDLVGGGAGYDPFG